MIRECDKGITMPRVRQRKVTPSKGVTCGQNGKRGIIGLIILIIWLLVFYECQEPADRVPITHLK